MSIRCKRCRNIITLYISHTNHILSVLRRFQMILVALCSCSMLILTWFWERGSDVDAYEFDTSQELGISIVFFSTNLTHYHTPVDSSYDSKTVVPCSIIRTVIFLSFSTTMEAFDREPLVEDLFDYNVT